MTDKDKSFLYCDIFNPHICCTSPNMFTPKYLLILLSLSKVLNGYCSKTAMFELKKGHSVSIDFLKTLENAGRRKFKGNVMNNTYLEIRTYKLKIMYHYFFMKLQWALLKWIASMPAWWNTLIFADQLWQVNVKLGKGLPINNNVNEFFFCIVLHLWVFFSALVLTLRALIATSWTGHGQGIVWTIHLISHQQKLPTSMLKVV